MKPGLYFSEVGVSCPREIAEPLTKSESVGEGQLYLIDIIMFLTHFLSESWPKQKYNK